jgi:hypothetical protein
MFRLIDHRLWIDEPPRENASGLTERMEHT